MAGSALRDSDIAYGKIKEMIIKTELKPGEVISETDLISKLSIGRTPIREALNRLSWDGLVYIVPRKGIFVSDLLLEDVQSIFEMRYELEDLAGRLAAERITDEQIRELQRIVKNNVDITTSFDKEVELDLKFHSILADATGNRFLQETLKRIFNFSLRLLYFAKSRMNTFEESRVDYLRVIEALKNRDGDTVSKILRKHVADFRKKVMNV